MLLWIETSLKLKSVVIGSVGLVNDFRAEGTADNIALGPSKSMREPLCNGMGYLSIAIYSNLYQFITIYSNL